MNINIVIWAIIGAAWLIATLTAWVAQQKGRKASEGFALGGIFFILGLVVELCLPSKQKD